MVFFSRLPPPPTFLKNPKNSENIRFPHLYYTLYFQHYQTAGVRTKQPYMVACRCLLDPPPPPMGGGGEGIFFIQCSFIFSFQKCKVFENLI